MSALQYTNPQLFIESVETYSGKKFQYRDEILTLMETAGQRNMQQSFEEVIFNAKFITRACKLLKRIGADNADVAKLSIELKEMMEKTTTLLRTIMKESPEGVKNHFLTTFFLLSSTSMDNLVALLYELHWVKNYLLDQSRPS